MEKERGRGRRSRETVQGVDGENEREESDGV
jgi:hypothetical protein